MNNVYKKIIYNKLLYLVLVTATMCILGSGVVSATQLSETTCDSTNIYSYISVDGNEDHNMKVDKLTFSNANPLPGEKITANIEWSGLDCSSCVIKANVFGDWDESNAIAEFYSGSNRGESATIDVTMPQHEGTYNLRFIWAFDIGSYSNYFSDNLPSESQCNAWGDSKTVILDKVITVSDKSVESLPLFSETTCDSTNIYSYISVDGNEDHNMKVDKLTFSNANPLPGEKITANIEWSGLDCSSCVIKANVFGDWDESNAIAEFYSGSNRGESATIDVTMPQHEGTYNLRFIWAFDIGSYSNYFSDNLPSESQCNAWGDSKTVILDKVITVSDKSVESLPLVANAGDDEEESIHDSDKQEDTNSLLFQTDDFKDFPTFAIKLKYSQNPLSMYLREHLSAGTLQLLKNYNDQGQPPEALQTALETELNQILQSGNLYDPQRFENIGLSNELLELIEDNPQGQDLVELNRLLLEEAYPQEIEKHRQKEDKKIPGFTSIMLSFALIPVVLIRRKSQ